ncbi:tyrosine phosphatase family protein [Afifella sp. IM 167]|uniref:tyrosine phosphatase family protein n=1 Tax=Afifella sp. IM 167 TaxID=2033586 RepID=UPI001CCDEAC3|nr:tyrosine phosphatase family protein [Afifella sp. IM 167]MBZ8133409.1 protein tyrosine phosphatase [Afifella sp. IM 167]
MPAIYVCPLAHLAATVRATGARHIATLINAGTNVPRPESVPAENHLFLGLNDISMEVDGMILPGEEHIARFVAFVEEWDRKAPLVVHCWAGISRSTAGAFTAYCALRPDVSEEVVARRLRARSPQATPNARIVALADQYLKREGRMVAAIEGIGRGANAFEGNVFALRIDE